MVEQVMPSSRAPFTAQQIAGIGMTSQRTRDRLVKRLFEKGIRDERVLAAIKQLPRHLFMDEAMASRAYEDTALPIGHGQTISQPYIVARMTEALIAGNLPKKVLEVGTGSAYQAAVLGQLVASVYTVERIRALFEKSQQLLKRLAYKNIHASYSDGTLGLSQRAPFDAIIVTAACNQIPEALCEQLAPGGRMVIPVGDTNNTQSLLLITRDQTGFQSEVLDLVKFVPFLAGCT